MSSDRVYVSPTRLQRHAWCLRLAHQTEDQGSDVLRNIGLGRHYLMAKAEAPDIVFEKPNLTEEEWAEAEKQVARMDPERWIPSPFSILSVEGLSLPPHLTMLHEKHRKPCLLVKLFDKGECLELNEVWLRMILDLVFLEHATEGIYMVYRDWKGPDPGEPLIQAQCGILGLDVLTREFNLDESIKFLKFEAVGIPTGKLWPLVYQRDKIHGVRESIRAIAADYLQWEQKADDELHGLLPANPGKHCSYCPRYPNDCEESLNILTVPDVEDASIQAMSHGDLLDLYERAKLAKSKGTDLLKKTTKVVKERLRDGEFMALDGYQYEEKKTKQGQKKKFETPQSVAWLSQHGRDQQEIMAHLEPNSSMMTKTHDRIKGELFPPGKGSRSKERKDAVAKFEKEFRNLYTQGSTTTIKRKPIDSIPVEEVQGETANPSLPEGPSVSKA